MIWAWVPNGMVWAIRSLEHRDAPPPHWSIFCLAISGGWEKSGGWSSHLTPIPGLQNADVQQLGIQPMTKWKSQIYIITIETQERPTSEASVRIPTLSYTFHHLLLGAKVNQCASVQQPTNLHLAPILIWEKNRKKARCFSKKPCVDQSYSHFFNYIHLQNLMKLQVSAVNTYPVSPNLYLWHWHCCWLLHRAGFRWLGMMRPDRSKEAPMEWDGIEGAPTEVNGCQL